MPASLRGRGRDVDHALATIAGTLDRDLGLVAIQLHNAVAVLRVLRAAVVEVKDRGARGGDGVLGLDKVLAGRVAEDQRERLRDVAARVGSNCCRTSVAGDGQALRIHRYLHLQLEVIEGVGAVGVSGVDCECARAHRKDHDDRQKQCYDFSGFHVFALLYTVFFLSVPAQLEDAARPALRSRSPTRAKMDAPIPSIQQRFAVKYMLAYRRYSIVSCAPAAR